jgi:hypothetical protein
VVPLVYLFNLLSLLDWNLCVRFCCRLGVRESIYTLPHAVRFDDMLSVAAVCIARLDTALEFPMRSVEHPTYPKRLGLE